MVCAAPTTLAAALAVGQARVVAFTGGGGKTSAMFRLAREWSGGRVLVTTTTRIWAPRPSEAALALADSAAAAVAALAPDGWPGGVRALGTTVSVEGKLVGVPPDWIGALAGVAERVLVEADGAAGKPLTAPRAYEPVIPASAEVVVPVVGAEAVGSPLDAEHVHRVAELSVLLGVPVGSILAPSLVAAAVLGPGGNTKGAPPGARIVPLVNKVDDATRLAAARALARELLARGAERVVLARLASEPPVVECWAQSA